MPYSMTGFAYVSKSFDQYEISVRMKSVNNKGIDISVKGSRDIIPFIELDVRKLIQTYFDRGSFQIFIELKYTSPAITLQLDKLKDAVLTIKNVMKDINLSVSDDKIYDLASDLAKESEEQVLDEETKNNILEVLSAAAEELKEERKKEGEKLVKDIEEKLKIIEQYVEIIDKKKDEIIEKVKQRTTEKVKELLGEEYSERAFIEATLLADKLDITEEIVRLKSHIQRFKELLKSDKPVGRKMDFLCQEMHREINTLGNKMPDFSEYTVEMKTTLEKIRQQVQNLE